MSSCGHTGSRRRRSVGRGHESVASAGATRQPQDGAVNDQAASGSGRTWLFLVVGGVIGSASESLSA